MAKKPKRMRAYRLKDETIFEIERLAETWECTQAEVVERAIATMAQVPAKASARSEPASELKVEYDAE